LCACRRNVRRGFWSAIHRIAMLIWAHAQWIYPDVWLQLATTKECSFKRADWQSDNKRWNCDGRTTCYVTRDINTGHGVNYQRNVFHPSDGPHSLWWRYSAWMEFFLLTSVIETIGMSLDSVLRSIHLSCQCICGTIQYCRQGGAVECKMEYHRDCAGECTL
jgi:hypothetical protein